MLLSALLVVIPSAHAERVVGKEQIACTTEEYLSQFFRALAAKDGKALAFLYGSRCVPLEGGSEVTVLDRGLIRTKVRAYAGGTTAELWMPSEGVR